MVKKPRIRLELDDIVAWFKKPRIRLKLDDISILLHG